jgi:Fe-S-cluster-containing hydrogenase component 2
MSKCDLCVGEGMPPACVEACPTGALSYAEENTYSLDKRRAYLVQLASETR